MNVRAHCPREQVWIPGHAVISCDTILVSGIDALRIVRIYMHYQLQRVDLQTFLRNEVPLSRLSPDLRQQIRQALIQGRPLGPLGARAVRELMTRGLIRHSGFLREGPDKIPLYSLVGSALAFDLRRLLAEEVEETADAPPEGAPIAEMTPVVETTSKSHARQNGNAWAVLEGIRSTLRRDWVSHGLEASLEDLLMEMGRRMDDPQLRLALWRERVDVALDSDDPRWEVWSDEDPSSLALLQSLQSASAGTTVGDRRWVGIRARGSIVGALGASPDTDNALHAAAAGTVGELFEAYLRSQQRVYTDPLTGVNNRRFFDRQLPVELERSRRLNQNVALLFVDIDFFKKINDEHGHAAGDRVLHQVAQSFLGHLRRIDSVFRWGGEEFALILPGTDADEALQTADRLREMVSQQRVTLDDGNDISVTVSVGAAIFPAHASGERELLRRADQALYRAKDEGRNRVYMWES